MPLTIRDIPVGEIFNNLSQRVHDETLQNTLKDVIDTFLSLRETFHSQDVKIPSSSDNRELLRSRFADFQNHIRIEKQDINDAISSITDNGTTDVRKLHTELVKHNDNFISELEDRLTFIAQYKADPPKLTTNTTPDNNAPPMTRRLLIQETLNGCDSIREKLQHISGLLPTSEEPQTQPHPCAAPLLRIVPHDNTPP